MKKGLILLAIVLVAGLLGWVWWFEEPATQASMDPTQDPSFELRIEKPRSARPFFGLVSKEFEAKLAGHGDLGFDHQSPGAEVGRIGPDRLELRADGYEFLLETDRRGVVSSKTRLTLSLFLANKDQRLTCRPEEPAVGELQSENRADSGAFVGQFRVELTTCENAETGRVVNWPPAPLIIEGRFVGLPPTWKVP